MSKLDRSDSVRSHGGASREFLLLVLVAAVLVCNGYLFWWLNRVEAELTGWQTSTASQISEIREAAAAERAAGQESLNSLRSALEAGRTQASRVAGRAKSEAQRHAEQLAAELAAKQRQVESELIGVKEAAGAANSRIADVSTEVAATKSELSSTVSELKRVTGDMGVMSGLIATNSKELATLRELDERNYFEFDLIKRSVPQRVGDISILVKRTDPKRSRYTVELLADDKRIEKKDKNANEPVQFYVRGRRQPYELVVNEIKKDRLIGYLATPKVQMARK